MWTHVQREAEHEAPLPVAFEEGRTETIAIAPPASALAGASWR